MKIGSEWQRSDIRSQKSFPKEIDRLWAEEAELRVSQIEEGKVRLIPGEEVFARIREKYEK